MKTSKILLISVFITVIILVVIGGAASAVMANQTGNQTDNQDQIEVYQQREEEYQRLLNQANQQIEQANADLQALQTQNQAAPAAEVQASAPASTTISSEQADEIAHQVVEEGHAQLQASGLVNFEGKTAYEVVFDNGSVYVDAMSGEVLFNGTVPLAIDQDQAVKIAMDYFNVKDVVLSDQISFRGESLFRVVFKNSLMVYIDSTGQIRYAQYATMKTQSVSSDDGGSSSSQSGTSSQSGGYEDEHEYEHEDD